MRTFFLTRSLRERVFLSVLVAIAAATWLSAVSGRVQLFWRGVQATSTEIADQRRWLRERPRIEGAAKAAVSQFDPKGTFNSVRLIAELDAIARSVGISKDTSIDDPQVSAGSQFSINSVRFVVRNVEWPVLQRFFGELSKRAPFIGVEECAVASNRANQSQLTASLRVSSVEIAR